MRLKRISTADVPVDIAPLIDVVFLLLLFFMLTSSFVLHPSIRVMLPKADTSRPISASKLMITLTKDHVFYWDEQAVTLAQLRRYLQNAGSETPVLIRADRYAYVDKLIELWDLCRDTGHTEVHIATLSE